MVAVVVDDKGEHPQRRAPAPDSHRHEHGNDHVSPVARVERRELIPMGPWRPRLTLPMPGLGGEETRLTKASSQSQRGLIVREPCSLVVSAMPASSVSPVRHVEGPRN